MITINLPRIAQIMDIERPYTLLVANGFTPQTAKDLLAGRTKRLALGHLEKLCRIFNCEPYDLLDYVPDKSGVANGPDPLAFLTKSKPEATLQSLVAGLSLKEMETLVEELAIRKKAA